MPIRRSRLLVHAALAVALVLAQVGALLHASSHDGSLHSGTAQHAQVCSQCLSFSTVLSIAGGTGAVPLALAAVADDSISDEDDLFRLAATPRPFWSQGPPPLV